MSGWDSYRVVYGAELRAAAHEFEDHGWPVVERDATTLLLVTGTVLDILEVPASFGRQVCAHLRDAGEVVPVGAAPTGEWWFPMSMGSTLPAELRDTADVRLHTAGEMVLAPPSAVPDGWVHWRVAPALSSYHVPSADLLLHSAVDVARWRADHALRPGAQRPAGAMAVGMRS
ncbi:bifunctional DNA primase/polymerase [Pseudonocardia sp. TRM90224]|uniref:bifunctional DNA primase/polymerase n=1 Tax=Pseudonocardia sp. TRM90224 TaxID=2812678 RepID=UPI001E4CE9E5|nr:bifunctional DNA primase/polymerase [Pseudonocardia sp. TRM90224]